MKINKIDSETMKRTSVLLLSLFSLFLLASCSQDLVETPSKPTGDEVIAHFSFSAAPMKSNDTKAVNTKAIDPAGVDENQISTMWVVQYDKATGAFIKKTYSENINVAAYDAPLAQSLSGASNVYFLANMGSTLATSYTEAEFLKQVKTLTDEASMLITGKPISGNTKLNIPMFGTLPNITVPASGFMETLGVNLTRALARIDVTYTVSAALTANFNLEGVRLCNVPCGIQFNPAPTASNAVTSTVPVQNFEIIPITGTTGTNTLTFYVPENQKGIGTNSTGTNERLKIGKTDATYIEFIGHTKGIQGGEEVGISIYPGKDILNDYNITRNTKYDITTTLADVSSSDQRVVYHGANCYVVHPGASAYVSVMAANKSELGLQIPNVTTGWTSAVYWQSAAGLVTTSDATASKGYFKVTAPDGVKEGNALVYVKDGDGNILWSWHIWVVTEDFNSTTYQEVLNGYTWMDRNLGAVSRAAAYNTTKIGFELCGGLYYQWGRKDPFIGTSIINTASPTLNTTYGPTTAAFVPSTTYSITGVGTLSVSSPTSPTNTYIRYFDASATPISYKNQLIASVRYPLLYLNNWTGSTATTSTNGSNSWGGEFNQPKSPYDPCPEGWRVPSAKKTSATVTTPWGSVGAYSNPAASPGNNGDCLYFNNGTGTATYFAYPANGWIGANYSFGGCGYSAYYWTATLIAPTSGAASALYFNNGTLSKENNNTRNFAQPLRCVKI